MGCSVYWHALVFCSQPLDSSIIPLASFLLRFNEIKDELCLLIQFAERVRCDAYLQKESTLKTNFLNDYEES